MLAASISRKACLARPASTPRFAPVPRHVACRSQMLSDLAAAGDVDAPIGVIIGAAVVVSLALTALVPLALSPGQQAANKIFAATGKTPVDDKLKVKKKK